ncbi:hypothetical protein N9A94_03155, partial [Akkermansiaceae bacterium]|nr:hypothetical protein [Akkermansiaceae bacterium]
MKVILTFLAIGLLGSAIAQSLHRYDPYQENEFAPKHTLGNPRIGLAFPISHKVARIGKTDYWLIGRSLTSYHQSIAMVKLDRDLGECTTMQVIEAGGVWTYSNQSNYLFAGRPNTDGANSNIHSEPGGGLSYSCFDLKSNDELWSFPNERPVLSASFSSDQKTVIVLAGESFNGSSKRSGIATLYWLDARTGGELKKVELPGESSFVPDHYYDGTLVDAKDTTYVFRKSEKEAQIFSVTRDSMTPKPLDDEMGVETGVDLDWKIRIQPIEEKWMTLHHRQKVIVYQLKDGKFVEEGAFESGPSRFGYDDCSNVKFTPDGRRLVAGSDRNTLIVDLRENRTEKLLEYGTSNLEFTSDGEFLVFWDKGGAWPTKVSNWKSVRDERVKREVFHCCPIETVSFSSDSKYVVSGDNHRFIVWGAENGQALAELTTERSQKERFYMMQSLEWDLSNGVVYGSDGFGVVKWPISDFGRGSSVRRLKGKPAIDSLKMPGSRYGLIDVSMDSTGEHLIVGDQRSVFYRSPSNPGQLKKIPLFDVDILSAPRSFGVKPGLECVFVASGGVLTRIDLAGVTEPKYMPGLFLAFSIDGDKYLSLDRRKKGEVEVRGLLDGLVTKTLKADVTQYSVFSLSPDGKFFAYHSVTPAHRSLVTLVDVEQGEVVAKVPVPSQVMSLAISPDGRQLAAGCHNRAVQVWEID